MIIFITPYNVFLMLKSLREILGWYHANDATRGGSRKFKKRGPKKIWREYNIAPNTQHMNILVAIAEYHSKDGSLQKVMVPVVE